MNADTKVHNKILPSRIQYYIKIIIYHIKWDLFQRCKVFQYLKICNPPHQQVKEKSHVITSINTEKASDKCSLCYLCFTNAICEMQNSTPTHYENSQKSIKKGKDQGQGYPPNNCFSK